MHIEHPIVNDSDSPLFFYSTFRYHPFNLVIYTDRLLIYLSSVVFCLWNLKALKRKTTQPVECSNYLSATMSYSHQSMGSGLFSPFLIIVNVICFLEILVMLLMIKFLSKIISIEIILGIGLRILG